MNNEKPNFKRELYFEAIPGQKTTASILYLGGQPDIENQLTPQERLVASCQGKDLSGRIGYCLAALAIFNRKVVYILLSNVHTNSCHHSFLELRPHAKIVCRSIFRFHKHHLHSCNCMKLHFSSDMCSFLSNDFFVQLMTISIWLA